jgi:tetratricopeptide (TPR) repeat protein
LSSGVAGLEALLERFRSAFRESPVAAYRDWFRLQERLAGEPRVARALADDLWRQLPEIRFDEEESRARFLHNAGVFFGTPGPAADLERARACFRSALERFAAHRDDGWRARALHNLATALSNLGTRPAELDESIALFREALEWRTSDREIARGVTLHNLGVALRRSAELDPGHAASALDASESALVEALAIRQRLGLEEGAGATRRQLEATKAAKSSGNSG